MLSAIAFARMTERKKYGLRSARSKPQSVKRRSQKRSH